MRKPDEVGDSGDGLLLLNGGGGKQRAGRHKEQIADFAVPQ